MTDLLIPAETLAAQLHHRNLLVVDCRFDLATPEHGEKGYEIAHIPGAIYAHLNRDLSDLEKPRQGRHPLPNAETFSATLSRWGYTPKLQIVCVDHGNGAYAARLWWMLHALGHKEVTILDGGMAAWVAAGLPVDNRIVTRQPTSVRVSFDASQLAGFEEVETARNDPDRLLMDARAAPRFRGKVEPIDAVAGHIPGAINRPFTENLDASGRFKSTHILHEEFDSLLEGRDPAAVIHMCGSGVTACHNLFSMEYAGLTGSRLFAPSWSGWISDSSRPVAR